MGWEAGVTGAIMALVLWGLSRGSASPDVLLVGGAVVLAGLSTISDQFPPVSEFASTFGNEGLLTIGALFVVASALTETGGVAIMAERLLGRSSSLRVGLMRLTFPVAGISAFLNNTPLVAMLTPVVADWADRQSLSRSKFLLPLSYAAVLGGTCTLIGTSTNLIVQGFLIQAARTDPTVEPFGLFTLTPIGVPVTLAGLAYMLLVVPAWLPDRFARRRPMDDPRQYTVEMRVPSGSSLRGMTIEEAGLRHLPGIYLSSIERGGETLVAVGSQQRLQEGDELIFVGVLESVAELHQRRGLAPASTEVSRLRTTSFNRALVEAVVSPRNPMLGQSVREARFRLHYDAAVVAVHRNGEQVTGKIGDIILRAGDTLLLQAHAQFAEKYRDSQDFLVVSSVAHWRPMRHEKAWLAISIQAAMIVAVTFEPWTGVSVFLGAMLAAGAMGLTGCISAERARRALDLPVLIAIAAALFLGRAMERTGLAGFIADGIMTTAAPLGPWGSLAGVYLLTLIFTELVTNNAAAALAFPIALQVCQGLHLSLTPFAVVIAIAASAGFATPLGYQTHLMVYGAGGYRFSDFVRVGVPLDILVGAIALALVPWVFPLYGR